jgi:hypothetical protein
VDFCISVPFFQIESHDVCSSSHVPELLYVVFMCINFFLLDYLHAIVL